MSEAMTFVNGVFEGGGSKGLTYIGAIEACEKRKIGFKAVAGSSAGAMTSMLVACGYSSTQLKKKVPEALSKLGNPALAIVTLGRRSLLSSGPLRAWLEEQLAADEVGLGPGSGDNGDHTFKDLYDKKEIALYVIAMDLATGQPIVFSPHLTPDAAVADAVVASSAIPVAFPSPRFDIDGEVRRLADGGVWSNYPSFVFLDDDFRAAHPEIDDGAEDRDTIGFILDSIIPERVADRSSDVRATHRNPLGSDRGAAPREFGLFGGFITSPFGHLTLCLLPVLLAILGASWFARELQAGMPIIGLLPDGLEDIAVLLLVVLYLFVLIQLTALAFVVIRLGRALADEGLMGTKAALGVGPNVPYWVGVHPSQPHVARRHVAVRLIVPSFLSTLKGHLKDEQLDMVLAAGRDQTEAALSEAFDGAERRVFESEEASEPAPKRRLLMWLASGATFCLGFVVMVWLTFEIVIQAERGEIGWLQLLGILVVLGVLELLHIRSRSRRASFSDLWIARLPSRILYGLAVVAAIAGVAGAVVLWVGDDNEVDLSLRDRLRVEPLQGFAFPLESLAALEADFDDDLLLEEFIDDFGDGFEDDFDELTDEEFDALLADFDEFLGGYEAELAGLGYFDDVGDGVWLYEVDLEQLDLEAYDPDGLTTPFRDLDGLPLIKCFEFEDCLVMRSSREYEFGEEVQIRYERQRSVLFFDEDRWRFTFRDTALSALYLLPLAVGYQLYLLAAWKREREGVDATIGETV